ncbi:MAG: DUF2723 domain-containing protein [Sandaracinaceae bacterium]|jgi:hypothetical protein|nr:DUF2723 domain-containing protein [Sandaracinaceae bacterium]
MGLLPKAKDLPTVRFIAQGLACGVPLASYFATASAYDYWLDSGEFVAAARNLGIAHPPGHPLSALVAHILTFFPIGPMAFRVACVSAIFAAVGAAALFRAIETTVRAMGITSGWISLPLALCASWLCTCSPGFWLQAIRPEVYALHACLAFVAIERIVHLEAEWPTNDVRPLYTACLCIGLALANHHFLAFLLLPVLAPTLARVHRVRGARALLLASASTLVGLATYLYLPLRAARAPIPNLGAPTDLSRIFWVVSAQAFQKSSGSTPQPMGERFLDVLVHMVDTMHVVPLLLAVVGLYVLVRLPGARRLGWVWGSVLLFTFVARAWLGFVRSNPDALGYLMPAFGAVAALAAAFVAKLLSLLGTTETRGASKSAVLVVLALCIFCAMEAQRTSRQVSLARFSATDDFDDARRRELPYGAVVLAHAPGTIFRHWGSEASDRVRPDLTLIPVPFLTYPGMVDELITRDPDVAPLLRGYLLDGQLRAGELQSLASDRPVFVELDLRLSAEAMGTLVPAGGMYEVLADGSSETDEHVGRASRQRTLQRLYTRLGRGVAEPETRSVLLWTHYTDALYYASVGDRIGATASLDRALALDPIDRSLLALQSMVNDETHRGRIDVTRFLETHPR